MAIHMMHHGAAAAMPSARPGAIRLWRQQPAPSCAALGSRVPTRSLLRLHSWSRVGDDAQSASGAFKHAAAWQQERRPPVWRALDLSAGGAMSFSSGGFNLQFSISNRTAQEEQLGQPYPLGEFLFGPPTF